MKRFIALIFTIGLIFSLLAFQDATGPHIVLPNSKLVGCKASGCSQVWQDIETSTTVIYPNKISIDIENGAVLGITALYDKSISVADLKASIDGHFGKSTYVIDNETAPVKVWRVEPQRISIQLATEDDGTKSVIYLSARAWDKKR